MDGWVGMWVGGLVDEFVGIDGWINGRNIFMVRWGRGEEGGGGGGEWLN